MNRKECFEARFKKFYPRLCSIACGYLPGADACEDVVQEAFIAVWNKGKDDLPEADFYAYMVRCVRNGCISYLRKDKHMATCSIDDVHPAQQEEWMEDHEQDTVRKHPEDRLNDVLGILPERCREIFLMSRLQSMKYKDIARHLEISEKTVENQMGKALKLLRHYAMTHSFQILLIVVLFQLLILKWK